MAFIHYTFDLKGKEDIRDVLLAHLYAMGFDSFEEKPMSLEAFVDDSLELDQEISELLADLALSSQYSKEVLPDINWNKEWESSYNPIVVQDRLYIRAAFHPEADYETTIFIQPKMSFGTGHHETTTLMLEFMLDMHFEDTRVLDMGCGTGVLGIYAAMKGAKSVTAIDIDEWAVENALENAAVNHVKMDVLKGGAERLDKNPIFDVILCNINKNILLRDWQSYALSMKPGALMLMSGILKSDLEDMEIKARELNFEIIEVKLKNEWISIKWKYKK